MNFLQISRPIDTISSETIFRIFGFPINNSTVVIFFITIFIILISLFITRKFKLVPGKLQSIIEIIYEAIDDHLFKLIGNKSQVNTIFPFITAIFIFVGISNLFNILPVVTNLTFENKSVLRSPTADFNTTFAIAFAGILLIQFASIKDFGFWGYLGRFFKFKEIYYGFKKEISAGLIAMIEFFIGLLDIVSEIARIISLSLRLFGNMYAGMVLTTVFLGICAYILPTFLVATGLLFAIVQAVVFGSLIAIYYSLSMKPG